MIAFKASDSRARNRHIVDHAVALADRLLDPARVRELACSGYGNVVSRGLSGAAGIAIFFSSVIQVCDEERYREALKEYLKLAAQDATSHYGLFPGLTGVLAACEYAQRVEPRYAGLAERCRAALQRAFTNAIPLQKPRMFSDYDVISGLAGYALTLGQNTAREVWDYLAWLTESERWSCVHPTLNVLQADLGMAHGIAGVIAALSVAPAEQRYEDALRSALQYLAGCYDESTARWPAWLQVDGAHYGRSGWCYGTPGCAAAMAAGAHRLQNRRFLMIAEQAMHHLAGLPKSAWKLDDNALCHGYMGTALIYAHVGGFSNSTQLTTTAWELADRVISDWSDALPYGYQATTFDGKRVDAPGLLDGAAGIALGLLTLAGLCDPSWTRHIGLTPVSRYGL